MSEMADFTTPAPLGGWLPGIQFTDLQARVLNAIADELIPGGDGFPAPSEVNVIGFVARYVAPKRRAAKWFPFLAEEPFKAWLDKLGEPFVKLTPEKRVERITAIEKNEVDLFDHLRDTIYYAYYSRSEVIAAINLNLKAGRDYRNTPQPFGYSDNMKDWDEALLSRVHGTYKRTNEVIRVDLQEIAR
jgi:Gluconate 2-dehydrogenase subunit 3